MTVPFRPKRDLLRLRQAGQGDGKPAQDPLMPILTPTTPPPVRRRLGAVTASSLTPPPALPTPETAIIAARRLPSHADRVARARLGGAKRMRKLTALQRRNLAAKGVAAKRKRRKLLRLEASRLDEAAAGESRLLQEALDRRGPEE